MKIIKGVQATHYKEKDYNIDTIYIRSNPKFYKIINDEKEEIAINEFNKIDTEKICIYDEEQYTYKEYSQVLEEQVAKVNKDNTITQTALVDLEMKFLKEGLYE